MHTNRKNSALSRCSSPFLLPSMNRSPTWSGVQPLPSWRYQLPTLAHQFRHEQKRLQGLLHGSSVEEKKYFWLHDSWNMELKIFNSTFLSPLLMFRFPPSSEVLSLKSHFVNSYRILSNWLGSSRTSCAQLGVKFIWLITPKVLTARKHHFHSYNKLWVLVSSAPSSNLED